MNNFRFLKMMVSFVIVILFMSACGTKQNPGGVEDNPSAAKRQAMEESPTAEIAKVQATSTSSPTPEPTAAPTSTPTPKVEYPVGLGTAMPAHTSAITRNNITDIQLLAEYTGNPTNKTVITADQSKAIVFTVEDIRIFDTKSGVLINKIKEKAFFPHRSGSGFGNWMTTNIDGSVIALLRDDYSIAILSDKGDVLAVLEKPKVEPAEILLILSPDGKFLAVDSLKREIYLKLFDVENNAYVNLPQYDDKGAYFSSDSNYLIFSTSDANILVLQKPDWSLVNKVATKAHDYIYGYSVINTTTHIGVITEKEMIVMDYLTNEEISRYPFYLGWDSTITNSQDGKYFIVGNGWDGSKQYYSVNNGNPIDPSSQNVDGNLKSGFADLTWNGWMNVASPTRGLFQFSEQQDGQHILIRAENFQCDVSLMGKYRCESLAENADIIVADGQKYQVDWDIIKMSTNPALRNVKTKISQLNNPSTIIGELPEPAKVDTLCVDYNVAFYTPMDYVDFGGGFGWTERWQYSLYDYKNGMQINSFDTRSKESIYGFCPPNTPYAITIINNFTVRDDQFNIVYLDGSAEAFANSLFKTKKNIMPVVALDQSNSLMAVLSTLPSTISDGRKVDHFIINVISFANPKDQVVLEIPPVVRTDLPDYEADYHTAKYEAAAYDLEISPDGSMAAIATFTGKVVFVDLTTGDILGEVQAAVAGIQGLAFTPDWTYMAIFDKTGFLKVFGLMQ